MAQILQENPFSILCHSQPVELSFFYETIDLIFLPDYLYSCGRPAIVLEDRLGIELPPPQPQAISLNG